MASRQCRRRRRRGYVRSTGSLLLELAAFGGLLALLVVGCARPAAQADASPASPTDEAVAAQGPPVEDVSANGAKPDAETANDATPEWAVPLIPRDVLFGNPDRAQARLSPDGRWISYLKPVDGVLNVWVGPADDPDAAEPVTEDRVRGIRSHSWAYTSRHILYTQDKRGDENWHVYATDVQSRETRDLTPIDGVRGTIAGATERQPETLLLGFNDRDPRYHDLYRVDLTTGERELLQENPGLAGFVVDEDLRVRMAVNFTPGAEQVWLEPQEAESDSDAPPEGGYEQWAVTETFSAQDATTSGPVGFNKDGTVLFFEDSRERDTAGLFARDLDTGETVLVADDPRVDVGGVLTHPTEKKLQAVSFTYSRTEWRVLDEAIRPDIEYLQGFPEQDGFSGEFIVTSRTLDDARWTVAYVLDDGPIRFYVYSRPPDGAADGKRSMRFLFNSRDDLEGHRLANMQTPVIESRDGLKLVSYLTLPVGSDADGDSVPDEPLPLVLDVHGGPWSRDGWGYNATAQWLANRGYAVLNVNFRGSTGFGKDFLNAANGEWAGKMHDDLLDAVEWAVERGVADPQRVAIMGGSYGGYATLVGMTFTPEVFACGVDIVGPSSLVTLLNNVPPYWARFMPVMKQRVGDWTTEEGVEELLLKSPLSKVEEIVRPLLIGQGANDPRVTQLEADQIVAAMNERDIPVTYALYPDEGHGFARPENRTSFNAVTEAFLAKHLGGRYEPIGDDLEGSSLHVPAGAEGVPGLAAVLPEERQQMPVQEAEEPDDAAGSDDAEETSGG